MLLLDEDGFQMAKTYSDSVVHKMVKRGEAVKVGPDAYQLRPGKEHLAEPGVTATAKRRAYLATQRKKKNR